MKKYPIQLAFLCLCIGGLFYAYQKEKQTVSVEYFKNGQILYPDYVCPDTLIVIDAKGLNKAMAYVEQDISWGSDADCDSLIHQYAIKLNP